MEQIWPNREGPVQLPVWHPQGLTKAWILRLLDAAVTQGSSALHSRTPCSHEIPEASAFNSILAVAPNPDSMSLETPLRGLYFFKGPIRLPYQPDLLVFQRAEGAVFSALAGGPTGSAARPLELFCWAVRVGNERLRDT